MLPKVIMKFGGTSLATSKAMITAVDHVVNEPRHPMVVVSALGGVTDLLLQSAAKASEGDSTDLLLDELHCRHHQVLRGLGLDPMLLGDLEHRLKQLVHGIALLREISPRVRDALLSLGERMSVRIFASALQRKGRPARAFRSWELGMLTTSKHGAAAPLPECPSALRSAMELLAPGVVPVVTGFIGRSLDAEITTMGRGGSDFSAALLGTAAGVEEIQIWTDVPGFLRADPRVVKDPPIIPALSFDEAAELSFFGAKVLHPRTIEPARRAGIPVRVLGTFHIKPGEHGTPEARGTLIVQDPPPEPVRALALHEDVRSLHLHSLHMLVAHGFLARVFKVLADHGLSVDVVATSEVSVTMTLDRKEGELDEAVNELSYFAKVERSPSRSILCLVGDGVRHDSALLARVFQILGEARVPVHVISQGASRINITLVTDPLAARVAMELLNSKLFS